MNENLAKPLSVRLTKKTRKKIEENANKSSMTLATYVRICIEKIEKEIGLPCFNKAFKRG